MGLLWSANSTSAFGDKYHVTEVYTSFSSSTPVKISDRLSYLKCGFRCGEAFVCDGEFDLQAFFTELNAQTVSIEPIGESYSIYAYSPKLKNFVKIGGKKVNLHVHVGDGRTKVATPLIYGSF